MCGVRSIGGVIHIVEQRWHCKLEAQNTGLSHLCTFLDCFRLIENHIVIQIMRQLPTVLRMRLKDVYTEEVRLIGKPFVNRIEAPGLVTERRSGITAEQQRNGFIQIVCQRPHFAGANAFFVD